MGSDSLKIYISDSLLGDTWLSTVFFKIAYLYEYLLSTRLKMVTFWYYGPSVMLCVEQTQNGYCRQKCFLDTLLTVLSKPNKMTEWVGPPNIKIICLRREVVIWENFQCFKFRTRGLYIHIQDVTGGTDQTSGGCSLC